MKEMLINEEVDLKGSILAKLVNRCFFNVRKNAFFGFYCGVVRC